MDVRPFRGFDHISVRGGQPPVLDVVLYRVVEQNRILRDNPDGAPQRILRHRFYVLPVYDYRARFYVVKPEQQTYYRALAASRRADLTKGTLIREDLTRFLLVMGII